MRKAVVHFVLAAVALVPSAGHAGSWELCTDSVPRWMAYANQINARDCYKESPMYSSDMWVQMNYCLESGDLAIAYRTSELKREAAKCVYCSPIADLMVSAANENRNRQCGFTIPADGRWSLVRNEQYSMCYRNYRGPSAGLPEYVEQTLLATQLCRLTHPGFPCASCHSSNTSASALTAPKDGTGFQDTIQRLKRPSKTSTKSRNIPSDPHKTRAGPTDPTKLIGPGILESDRGFARQGPARAGSPLGTGGSSGGAAPTLPPNLR
jgi:hypothetical protein